MLARRPLGFQDGQNVPRGNIRYRTRPQRLRERLEAVGPLVAVLLVRERLDARRLKHANRDFAGGDPGHLLRLARFDWITTEGELFPPAVAQRSCIGERDHGGVAETKVFDTRARAIAVQPSSTAGLRYRQVKASAVRVDARRRVLHRQRAQFLFAGHVILHITSDPTKALAIGGYICRSLS
jgi:hypothetical protein